MFDEDQQSEDVKAFEAALTALRPRTEKLDPRWRFLLAEEAALNEKLAAGGDPRSVGPSICSRCGGVSSGRRDKRRWAWPAAFSAMTTVATVLLVAIIVRPAPQIALQIAKQGVSPTSTALADKQADPADWLAMGNMSQRRIVARRDDLAYLNLREQVLRCGVESWQLPISKVSAATEIEEPVLSSRDQLDRLLKQESLHGS